MTDGTNSDGRTGRLAGMAVIMLLIVAMVVSGMLIDRVHDLERRVSALEAKGEIVDTAPME